MTAQYQCVLSSVITLSSLELSTALIHHTVSISTCKLRGQTPDKCMGTHTDGSAVSQLIHFKNEDILDEWDPITLTEARGHRPRSKTFSMLFRTILIRWSTCQAANSPPEGHQTSGVLLETNGLTLSILVHAHEERRESASVQLELASRTACAISCFVHGALTMLNTIEQIYIGADR